MRQHGEREEKNEFEELVSVATSLQDSKPAQVLTLDMPMVTESLARTFCQLGNLEMTAGLLRLGNDFLMSTGG